MTAQPVGIIQMDLHGSTVYHMDTSTDTYVALQKKLFNAVSRSIDFMSPNVVLLEVLGDSFMVLVGSPFYFSANMRGGDCAITIVVAKSLACAAEDAIAEHIEKNTSKTSTQNTCVDVYMRTGVAAGRLAGDVASGVFRVYGVAIHKAARLESVCHKNHIMVDASLMENCPDEVLKYQATRKNINLKDFGPTPCMSIDFRAENTVLISNKHLALML